MKNMVNFFGNLNRAHGAKVRRWSKVPLVIIAVLAVIGFTACDTGGGGDGDGGGSAYLGDELVLSGEVYTAVKVTPGIMRYTPFTGTETVYGVYGEGWWNGIPQNNGEGGITNGNLSYTLGTPRYLDSIRDIKDLFSLTDLINASDTSVSYYLLDLTTPNGDDLRRVEMKGYASSSSYSETWEYVHFVYVDGDVTLSGVTSSGFDEYEDGSTFTWTSPSFSLDLKQGWNAVYCKWAVSGSGSSMTITETWALKNPALKWVLYE
jgi:hypothetical protein